MTTRIAWIPLVSALILASPADAGHVRTYIMPDGSIQMSDKPVPGGIPADGGGGTEAQGGNTPQIAPPRAQPLSESDMYLLTGQVQLPRDRDVLQALLDAVKYAPPASRWVASEKALYLQLLSRARADVVVAPVQVEGAAFDQPERLLMMARLAHYLERPGRSVADPFLVERALGEGARHVEMHDVEQLAGAVGATRIVVPFAGHDRAGRMNLRVRVVEMKQGAPVYFPEPVEKSWTGLSFQDDSPSQVLGRLLPEINRAFGFGAQETHNKPRLLPAAEPLPVPKSPEMITLDSNEVSPVLRAYQLQLLGALHPWYSEHARDRAFVRSLLVLDEIAPESSDYRALKARALFYLNRRPLALLALGEPKTAEERALQALLNGNLPDLEAAVPQIKAPLKKLLAELELSELRARYDALDRQGNRQLLVNALAGSPQWQTLVLWKARDWDQWFQRSNLELKAMLDATFPAPGPTAETMVRAQTTLNGFDPRSAEMELSVYRHTSKLLTAKSNEWCCRNAFAIPNRWDYLDLIVDLAETNLVRQVEFYLNTQGSPERAAELLAKYESVYRDHPAFTSVRGWTDWRLAERRQGPERDGLRQQGLDSALRAVFWAQGQTWGGWDGLRLRRADSRLGAPIQADDPVWVAMYNGYIGDWPIRWYWPTWEQGGNPLLIARNESERVAYSTYSFNAVIEAMQFADDAGKKKILEETANRFIGAPDRVGYLAQQQGRSGNLATKKQLYQDAIRANPNAWQPYHELGLLAIEEGNYVAARKMFQSYPGFSPTSTQDRVALSQYANEAGSELYWRGAIDEAVPLYKLAAGYRTGSNGSMTSSLRLKLLEGDYQGAAEESLERVQRYDTVYAYRDFLALLHVMGHSKEAWPAFESVMEKFENPQIWASAHVGHRIAGAKDADVERWLRSDHVKSASAGDYRFAPNFAVLWYVVDRKPGPGFAQFVQQLDTPARNFVAPGMGWTVRGDPVANPEGGGLPFVGPSNYKAAGRAKRAAGTIVRSDLAYFAEAYGLMRNGDYVGANRVFEEMAQHYEFAATYAAAYFARAAAKSGNGDALEAYLDQAPPADPARFDYHLAKAFLVAAKDKHEDALKHLNAAFNVRPYTDGRPIFTEYQFAEACEWLYQDSRNAGYRKLALNWAQKHQRIAPMYSWAYAMEAELTASPNERRRALGITLYLDPNSERASKFSAAERQQAREWMKANNPFLVPRGKRDEA